MNFGDNRGERLNLLIRIQLQIVLDFEDVLSVDVHIHTADVGIRVYLLLEELYLRHEVVNHAVLVLKLQINVFQECLAC